MDKPVSMSVKAWIIRKLSVQSMVQESVIENVVNHQFAMAMGAMDTCYSLEFSGFGKFYFNQKRAIKKMEKLESQKTLFTELVQDPFTSPTRRRSASLKLETALKNIEALKPKINKDEIFGDIRGMEEQAVPAREDQAVDS